jgi:DNA-binding transcriptional LysR family regulator
MKSELRDWSDVRVFLAVVRAGSTLAASKVLGMAQPTVARRIETLERALGLVLFERDTRGFQPTAEARALINHAQTLETAALDFSDAAQQQKAGTTRTIRFTAFKDAFNHRLGSVIEAFVLTHPDVRFEFLPSDDKLDLAAGEADVALRGADIVREPTLICRTVRHIGFSLFASKSYAERHPLPSSEAELSGHRFAVHQERHVNSRSNQWLLAHIEPHQIAMAVNETKAMEAAILMGAGIGILPTPFGRNNETLIRCFELPPETATTIWLLVNPIAWRRPEVKAFAAFFVPRYRAQFLPSSQLPDAKNASRVQG